MVYILYKVIDPLLGMLCGLASPSDVLLFVILQIKVPVRDKWAVWGLFSSLI